MSSRPHQASRRWTPFDGSIYRSDPHAELSKVGVIDVGSNSVRMVVFDGAARSPAYFYNEKVMCELGAGLSETGVLNPEGRRRALAAIARFVQMARAMEVPKLTAVKELAKQMGPQHNRLFLVGGSWRTLARIDMHRRGYPLHVLHEYRMDSTSVHETIDYLANEDHAELRVACGVSENRMALVPYAAEVLHRLLKEFKPADIAISSYGIREGMLYEVMPDDMRAADPLLAACRFVEEKDARVPGFGDRLYEFVTPLFADAEEDFQRIIRAACLLHDVSWRAHPDFRANLCFETATRSNLGGLKHWERVFLGVSLLHRYRNKREGSPYSDLFPLLSDTQIEQAEILGKAMRIGAMLWVKDNKKRAALNWNETTRELVLELSQKNADLFGEVCAARLGSLASTLNASSRLLLV
ncbi:MAG: hypothetical protein EBZ23_13810 [Rhodobacteraceae bacterium]|nr:hypothetical protein [Paracoccaceae bacterium]